MWYTFSGESSLLHWDMNHFERKDIMTMTKNERTNEWFIQSWLCLHSQLKIDSSGNYCWYNSYINKSFSHHCSLLGMYVISMNYKRSCLLLFWAHASVLFIVCVCLNHLIFDVFSLPLTHSPARSLVQSLSPFCFPFLCIRFCRFEISMHTLAATQ